jgi:hypothetical protein
VIFDDFRGSWFKLSTLLQILDSTPTKVKSYGRQVEFMATNIFITSNMSPVNWYNTSIDQVKALCRRIDVLEIYTGTYPDVAVSTFVNSLDDMHHIYSILKHDYTRSD